MIEKELFILLGTNLGDRLLHLETAKKAIEKSVGKVVASSKIYETAAWGITDQPNFLNQVLKIETSLKPEKTLHIILTIEEQMGRIREQKWGARLIDIDILYFGSHKINTDKLTIPHPFLQDRRFTLIPLVEIASGFIHPVFKKSNSALLQNCKDYSDVFLIEN